MTDTPTTPEAAQHGSGAEIMSTDIPQTTADWMDCSTKEKCRRYEESYVAEYRSDVQRLTKALALAQENLKIAEQQFASDEPVTSKFARRWGL